MWHRILFIVFSLLTLSVEAQDHKWKMATSWTGGPMMEHGAKAFAERVEFLTEGRVKIRVHPAGVFGKALKVSETVQKGVVECGHLWTGYDWGKDRTSILFAQYAGGMDSERLLHWLYEAGGLELWKKWRKEKFNLVAFPVYSRPAEIFLHSHKPVRSLADLKGLKIRTTGAWLEISKNLGAAPISTAGGDVFPMLERKVIDATEWGTPYENKAPGFYRIAKYIIVPGAHQPSGPIELVINPKAWEKLSPRDQKLVELAGKQITLESWMKIGSEDLKAMKFYQSSGNEIIELDTATLKEIKRLGVEWAENYAKEDAWFQKVFEHQRSFEESWKDAERYRKTDG